MGLIAVAGIWSLTPTQAEHEIGAWGSAPPVVEILLLFVSVIAGFIGGAFIASKTSWLRRLFTPQKQMKEEVEARACQVFLTLLSITPLEVLVF